VIFDGNGKKIQDIVSDTGDYWNLRAIDGGFVVINTGSEVSAYASNSSGASEVCSEVYYLKYNIETKISGEGTISVLESSLAGQSVTFTISPQSGYVLSVVKVTDSNGNVIEFTSNTFKMPSSNVTIEAIFVPSNPETRDVAILAIVIFILISVVVGVISCKGIKNLS